MDCFLCPNTQEGTEVLLQNIETNRYTADESHQHGTAEDSTEDKDEPKEDRTQSTMDTSSDASWGACIGTNMLVAITFTCYAGGCVASQLTKANVLQINFVRYVTMAVLTFGMVLCFQYPLGIRSCHHKKLAVCIVLHQVYANAYYFTASFMPVGNFDGIQSAFSTILATSYDFCKGKINKLATLSALLAVIGITLLTQPWKEKLEAMPIIIPCEYFENMSQPIIQQSINKTDTAGTQAHTFIWMKSLFQKHRDGIGYLLMFAISILSVVRGVFVRDLIKHYQVVPLVFWHTVFESICSCILCLMWSQFVGQPYFDIPSGTLCFIITLLFIGFAVSGNTLAYFAYKHTYVSTYAVIEVLFAAFLYTSQRTFLKQFHPGHANIVEVAGIVIVIFSVSILRMISFILEKQKLSHQ